MPKISNIFFNARKGQTPNHAHLSSVGALSKNHLWKEEKSFLQYQEPEPGFPLLKREKKQKNYAHETNSEKVLENIQKTKTETP